MDTGASMPDGLSKLERVVLRTVAESRGATGRRVSRMIGGNADPVLYDLHKRGLLVVFDDAPNRWRMTDRGHAALRVYK